MRKVALRARVVTVNKVHNTCMINTTVMPSMDPTKKKLPITKLYFQWLKLTEVMHNVTELICWAEIR